MSFRKGRFRNENSQNDTDLVLESGDAEEAPSRLQLKGDEKNIVILFFLYLLQGIPLGLMQAIPIILTNTGVSYTQQAQFSLVNWPFSLKLLWAPIVDSLYFPRMGKRKSWLVPVQYMIALVMLFLSFNVNDYLAVDGKTEPNMLALVFSFFLLNFLAATQDIAVDGWALTMLKRENVGYASTCNSVGQTAGYLFGFVAFIALESASFCNTYLRTEPEAQGLVTLPGYLQFWGWVFLAATTLTWLFKSERPPTAEDESLNVRESYKTLYRITCLRPIRQLAAVLLTAKVAFAACDALTGLKLIEAGIAKEKMALLAIPLVPLQILLPLFLSKTTAGPYPMNVYLKAYPFRLGFSLVIAFFVWLTPAFIDNGVVPNYYYALLLGIYSLHQITLYSMFVASMAFFAKISDPAVGGTYMTLVNTLANLGGNWPATLSLWVVESLSYKGCSKDGTNSCWDKADVDACTKMDGKCDVIMDGYYVETILGTVFGVLWLLWGKRAIRRLQSHSLGSYAVASRGR